MKTKTKANTNLQSASMSGTCGRVCLDRPEGREGEGGRRREEERPEWTDQCPAARQTNNNYNGCGQPALLAAAEKRQKWEIGGGV